MRFLHSTLFATSLFLGSALAAAETSTAPLLVSTSPLPDGSDFFTIQAENTSDKPIRAFTLLVNFTNAATGQGMGRAVRTVILPSGTPGPQFLFPGQTNTQKKAMPMGKTPDGQLAKCVITVDKVVFQDGSTWGPASQSASKKLVQMIELADHQH